jgi:hypothetical protein
MPPRQGDGGRAVREQPQQSHRSAAFGRFGCEHNAVFAVVHRPNFDHPAPRQPGSITPPFGQGTLTPLGNGHYIEVFHAKMDSLNLPCCQCASAVQNSQLSTLNSPSTLFAELQRGQTPVNSGLQGLQFLVRAGFHDPSACDDDDSIHVPHGGEPVGDDE